MGFVAASMTDYCKGRCVPTVELFVSLENLYDISIDNFLPKNINPSASTLPTKESTIDRNMMTTYHKYCCIYFVYYFDTIKYKGRDTQSPKDSVLYEVLLIYENPSSLDVSEFSYAAVLRINDRDKVALLKSLESFDEPTKIIDYIGSKYPNTAYYVDFELTQEHAFVSMTHTNTDKALLIFHV